MGQRKKKQSEGGGSNWLTTFNDLVTLLMVFFVLIFAMSSGDANKLLLLRNSIMRGLGLLEAEKGGSEGLVKQPLADCEARQISPREEDTSEIPDEIKDYISDIDSAMPWIDASITENGVTITLEGSVAFEQGIADINPRVFPALEGIGEIINKIPNAVRVEGHADNVPISTPKFPSNWELSIARAVNVTKYLIKHANVSPFRLSAVGYGDSRPLVPNNTANHKAKNRRVEIVLLREDKT
ncbi:MAG: OmpA family protein [Deltaproteobacteria bacterium]|nr:OmpA family protein [Deltaproteobacteria bacterium]